MLKLSEIASYAALIFITFTSQFSSAANSADRAFLGFTPAAYSIGGTVTGLQPNNQVLLQNNGSDELVIQKDNFEFSTPIVSGGSYSVTIAAMPPGQTCSVRNSKGVVNKENVTNIKVECVNNGPYYSIGGTVNGLNPGGQVMLSNNGNDPLFIHSNGAFAFPTPVVSGGQYQVIVNQMPPGQICTVSNSAGYATANVTNIQVECGN